MARAADLRDKAGAMTVRLRSGAVQAGHVVQGGASWAGHAVEHDVPRPVRTVVQAGPRHPRPVLVVGVVVGVVVAEEMRRRNGRQRSGSCGADCAPRPPLRL
ncbi:hypothetical protein [Streptomyces sp. S3(2020)]|uniref:hypothetical protein n=1 Tax=Streptomyces sp. S3(2020) TaxID=2732044 RepID=UPI00321809C8